MKESIFNKINLASTELDMMRIAINDSPYIYYLPEDETKAIMNYFCSKASLAAKILFFNNCPTKHADLVIGTPSLHKAIDEFNKFRYLYHKTIKEHSTSYISAGHREVDVFIMLLSANDLAQIAADLYAMYEVHLPRHSALKSKCSLSELAFRNSLPSLKRDLIAAFDFAKSKSAELQGYDHLISQQ